MRRPVKRARRRSPRPLSGRAGSGPVLSRFRAGSGLVPGRFRAGSGPVLGRLLASPSLLAPTGPPEQTFLDLADDSESALVLVQGRHDHVPVAPDLRERLRGREGESAPTRAHTQTHRLTDPQTQTQAQTHEHSQLRRHRHRQTQTQTQTHVQTQTQTTRQADEQTKRRKLPTLPVESSL